MRTGRSFAGIRRLKWEAAVFCNRQWMNSYDGAVLLNDGPEHWGEVEFSGEHSHNRLGRRVAEALPRHKGEICGRAESRRAPRSIRVWRRASSRRFLHTSRRGGRTVRTRGSAVFVWCCFFQPDVLRSHLTAHQHVLQAVVSGERRASLTFTKLCPPVLEPHLDVKSRCITLYKIHKQQQKTCTYPNNKQ